MKKLVFLSSAFALLLAGAASGASLPESTWPKELSDEDMACLAALRPADHLVHSAAEFQRRLENIRSAWLVCQIPEVDARFFARSVRLRLTIPEPRDNSDQLVMLQEARHRLERLREPPPELFRVLDVLGDFACRSKNLELSVSLFEDSRRLRERIYGEATREASEGMIHLARLYATACETNASDPQRARMYAEHAVENFIGCGGACRPAYLDIVMKYASVLEDLGLREGSEEVSNLFLREWSETPGTSASAERDDEPLPESPAQP